MICSATTPPVPLVTKGCSNVSNLEEVFRRQGPPTVTFVEPSRYTEIKLALREVGRCVVIEGPSGIGKSTIVDRALSDLGMKGEALTLSARKPDDLGLVEEILREGK